MLQMSYVLGRITLSANSHEPTYLLEFDVQVTVHRDKFL